MPVIISEVVIRGTIEAPPVAGAVSSAVQAATAALSAEERAALIATIVEEVLRTLDRMKER